MTRNSKGQQVLADIEVRRIDNPHTSFAQFLHELRNGEHDDAGIIRASVSMVTLVGGAHRFFGAPGADGREMRLEACRIFKATYEASQVGGARAVDPSNEPVDGGWLNPHAAFERGALARKQWSEIEDAMSRVEMKRLHFVIVGEWGPTAYARFTLGVRQPTSMHISRASVEFRGIVDKLAGVLGLARA